MIDFLLQTLFKINLQMNIRNFSSDFFVGDRISIFHESYRHSNDVKGLVSELLEEVAVSKNVVA